MAFAVGVKSGSIGIAPAAFISARSELAEDDQDHHPLYTFSYSVEDISTGDNKHQHESRDGDSVVGQVSRDSMFEAKQFLSIEIRLLYTWEAFLPSKHIFNSLISCLWVFKGKRISNSDLDAQSHSFGTALENVVQIARRL